MEPSTSEVSPDSFEEIVSKHRVVVLHFWAAWNNYDKQMDATLMEIESENSGRVFFGSVDTDNHGHWQKCKELRILNLPAIVSFANGKHLETVIGLLPKENLSKKIKDWVSAAVHNSHVKVGRFED